MRYMLPHPPSPISAILMPTNPPTLPNPPPPTTEGFEALAGGTTLLELVKGSQWEAGIKIQIDNLRGTTSDAGQVGAASYWPVSSGDFVMVPLVAGMLRRQYGMPLDFAKELSAY